MYCGVELDARAAEQARRTIDEVHEGNATAIPLPYDAGTFDVLIFADILEHIPRPAYTVTPRRIAGLEFCNSQS
jgi:2-polyprenyl-3-methyl-5-hydroxy-6-metoxy-1,4-benzoquinol methylase